MKKSTKYLTIITSILLSVAPITNLSTIAKATNTTASTNSDGPYFTYNNQSLADNATIPTNLTIKDNETVGEILEDAKNAVGFFISSSSSNGGILTSATDVIEQLKNQNVMVSGTYTSAKITTPVSGFTITLTGRSNVNGKLVKVSIPFGKGQQTNAPIINVEYQQLGKSVTSNVNGIIFQVAVNSTFNPLDITGSNGTKYKISSQNATLRVLSNPVDTSKPGSFYTVKLTAKNTNGTESNISYTILVTPTGQQTLNVAPAPYIMAHSITTINGKATIAEGSVTLKQGAHFYASNHTLILNGKTYTKISIKSQAEADTAVKPYDLWLETSTMTNSNPIPETIEKTIMHKALVYDNVGGSKIRTIPAFKTVTVESAIKTIKGQKYYKIANEPDYIKASNIDGTVRTLRRNAYIYSSSKHRTSFNNVWKLYRGKQITTYGGSFKFKNSKRYYRIGANKQYVRTSNF